MTAPQATDVRAFDAAEGRLPTSSLALEASAGTGKTWTLTALAVRVVLETEHELKDLLLVTFTRAATAELKDRVRRRLIEVARLLDRVWSLTRPGAADLPPDAARVLSEGDALLRHVLAGILEAADLNEELARRRERLRRALAQLDEATIATIHGFCQSMLHHAALEAGLDFDAVLLEDDEELLAEIVDDHLAQQLRPADPEHVRFLRQAGAGTRDGVTRLARRVAALPELQLRPDLDPRGTVADDLAVWTEAVDRFRAVWQGGGRDGAEDMVARLKEQDTSTQQTFTPAKAAARVPAIDAWLAAEPAVPPAWESKDLHLQADHPYAMFTSRALGSKLELDPEVLRQEPLIAAADDLLDAAHRPATRFLLRSAGCIWAELDRRKRQRTVLTFDDLLRRLDAALTDPVTRDAVRDAIRQRYRLALIDEFQDTDPIQWRIFSTLFDVHEPLVLIGDPKQAIYGFRGADIATYVRARDGRTDQATLQRNHRSDRSFVAACNLLFGDAGAFGTADIPYHPIGHVHEDRLVDPSGGHALEVRFLRREVGGTAKTGASLITKGHLDRYLPGDVAAVAVELLEAGAEVVGADGDRPLAPRDIAVLVRTNRRARAVQQALLDAGVPAVIQRGGSVYDTEEAVALQRLLDAMLRPSSRSAAAGAAASVLGGRDGAWLAAGLTVADEPTPADGLAWDVWVEALGRWGARWSSRGVLDALHTAMAEDGIPERLLAHADGDRRLTNLRHLLELLHSAEVDGGLAPLALSAWFAARRADAADDVPPGADVELRLEADAEAVRVVTVHGSKGLQYPVVLCPDLWDGSLRTDAAYTRFHDPEVTDPVAAITLDVDTDHDAPGKQRSLALARREEQLQAIRLTYVALTRAQHRAVVWWGPITDAPTSALAGLLHARGEQDPRLRLEQAENRVKQDDDTLLADLAEVAASAPDSVGVTAVRALGAGARWRSATPATPELTARAFTRGRLDSSWRRTSFTALVRDAGEHGGGTVASEGSGRDVDAAVADQPGVPAGQDRDAEAPEVPLGRFPRGPGPGTFLHDVLEHLDLTRIGEDEHLDPVLTEQARRHGIASDQLPSVRRGLRAAVSTSLGPELDDLRLSDLRAGDRGNELRFELPLAGGAAADGRAFRLHRVADLLADSSDPLLSAYADRLRDPALAGAVRGYLNGSIDLLARLGDGRFLVADYKSNWFGDRASGRSVVADYAPDALATSMLDHHYVLQGLLYLVAAHRFLRWRVPGYAPETHLAGAGYLFLRGMVGAADGVTGVVLLQPEASLVTAVSAELDGGGR